MPQEPRRSGFRLVRSATAPKDRLHHHGTLPGRSARRTPRPPGLNSRGQSRWSKGRRPGPMPKLAMVYSRKSVDSTARGTAGTIRVGAASGTAGRVRAMAEKGLSRVP